MVKQKRTKQHTHTRSTRVGWGVTRDVHAAKRLSQYMLLYIALSPTPTRAFGLRHVFSAPFTVGVQIHTPQGDRDLEIRDFQISNFEIAISPLGR